MPLQPQVNQDIYRSLAHSWWDESVGEFSTLRFWINPVRFGFFERVLRQENLLGSVPRTLLDVGCGGGLLAEEFARAGFSVTGIDPSAPSIETARAHAAESGLSIEYQTGSGEDLWFPDASFDCVACCDVLEHVDDVNRVIAEVARVLKPGGLFFYDTINRTFMSRIAIIKLMQEWRSTAFAARAAHVWEKFIKPSELVAFFERHGLEQREMRGIGPRCNPISAWLGFRKRAQGKITFQELGQRLNMQEGAQLGTSYMGYAVRRAQAEA